VAVAECCLAGGLGARLEPPASSAERLEARGAPPASSAERLEARRAPLPSSADRLEARLFGEGPGAFVVSGPRRALAAFGAAATVLGEVGGDELALGPIRVPFAELARVHADGLAGLLR
jgi:hypothetical protein